MKRVAQSGLNFGEALAHLKDEKCISRAGWNGKDMFLFLNRGNIDVPEGGELPKLIEGVPGNLFTEGDKGTVTRLPNINMKTALGSTLTGWLASQTDMLAEDWCVLEDVEE